MHDPETETATISPTVHSLGDSTVLQSSNPYIATLCCRRRAARPAVTQREGQERQPRTRAIDQRRPVADAQHRGRTVEGENDVGPCAVQTCKSRQARKGAAVRRHLQVPQANPADVP